MVKALSQHKSYFPSPLTRHERASGEESKEIVKFNDLDFKVKDLDIFTSKEARKLFTQNKPILAAASHLSISDSRKAVKKLILSNNLTYAYALCDLLFPEGIDQVVSLLYLKAMVVDQDTGNGLNNAIISKIRDQTLADVLKGLISNS